MTQPGAIAFLSAAISPGLPVTLSPRRQPLLHPTQQMGCVATHGVCVGGAVPAIWLSLPWPRRRVGPQAGGLAWGGSPGGCYLSRKVGGRVHVQGSGRAEALSFQAWEAKLKSSPAPAPHTRLNRDGGLPGPREQTLWTLPVAQEARQVLGSVLRTLDSPRRRHLDRVSGRGLLGGYERLSCGGEGQCPLAPESGELLGCGGSETERAGREASRDGAGERGPDGGGARTPACAARTAFEGFARVASPEQ